MPALFRTLTILITFLLLSSCGGGGGGGSAGGGQLNTDATLQSIAVTLDSTSIAKGTFTEATVTGTWSDGTSRTIDATQVSWQASPSSIAEVVNGRIQGKAEGNATIRARIDNIESTASISVTAATLQSISLSSSTLNLAKNTSANITAQGSFSDHTSQNISSLATWHSSNPAIATINAQGQVTGLTLGTTTISATYNGITEHITLTVTSDTVTAVAITSNATSLPAGLSTALMATAFYSDGTSRDITTQATWSVSSGSGSISNTGVVQTTVPGSLTLQASWEGRTDTTIITVTAASLQSITVTPSTSSIPKGLTRQFIASGTYTDNSSHDISSIVIWSSGNTTIATVQTAGNTQITAHAGSITGSATIKVTAASLQSLIISPSNLVMTKDRTQRLTVSGLYSDGTSLPLTVTTWSSNNTSIAGVDAVVAAEKYGLVYSRGVGSAQIQATYNGITASVNVTVSAETNLKAIYSFEAYEYCGSTHLRLIADEGGNIYGKHYNCGVAENYDEIFKIDRNGIKNIIWRLKRLNNDGNSYIMATDIAYLNGNIYGIYSGKSPYANNAFLHVFKLNLSEKTYTIPASKTIPFLLENYNLAVSNAGEIYFQEYQLGGKPQKLVADNHLSGSAYFTLCSISSSSAYGGIFNNTNQSLYIFGSTPGDGGPKSCASALLIDSAGDLYGAAGKTIFSMRTTEPVNFRILHEVQEDITALVRDNYGNFYGATASGGQYGTGRIFKIDASSGTETTLYSFETGDSAASTLVIDSLGNLYGVSPNKSGRYNNGFIFKMAL